jgi:glucose-1-phosphate thymidylyltransferase
MRAIILAGGYAKRLWPLTLDKPKSLLPIGDGTILDFIMAKTSPLGLKEVIISTNQKFGGKFEEWIEARGLSHVRVVPEPSLSEDEKLGPIKALDLIMEDAQRDDYLIAAGDNLFSLDLSAMAAFFKKVKSPVIVLYEITSYELARQYAVVEINPKSRIVSFVEKPAEPKCLLISTGIYMLPWKSATKIGEYLRKGNPPDPIGRFIGWLSENEKSYGFKFSGYWYDIGSLESYREVQADFMHKSYKG